MKMAFGLSKSRLSHQSTPNPDKPEQTGHKFQDFLLNTQNNHGLSATLDKLKPIRNKLQIHLPIGLIYFLSLLFVVSTLSQVQLLSYIVALDLFQHENLFEILALLQFKDRINPGIMFPAPIIAMTFTPLAPIRNLLQRLTKRESAQEAEEIFESSRILQQFGHNLITTPLNTDLILEMLLNQIEQVFTPVSGFVFLRKENKKIFTIRAGEDSHHPSHTVAVQFGVEDDLAQWLTDTKDIFQLPSKQSSGTRAKISTEELARLKMLNVTHCIPLSGSKNLLGWVALGEKNSDGSYDSDDLIFLATLANQTAIALENAQLLEQANQRAAELEALQKISAEIQAEAQSDKLLSLVVEQASKLLQARGGMVYLLEPDESQLKVVVCYNLDKDYCATTINLGEDVAGQVVALDKPILVDNYYNFSNRADIFDDAEFGAVLGVPLRWGGVIRGVLQVIHAPNDLRFNEHDIWLIEFFATQSALSLEQSSRLKTAQGQVDNLAALGEVNLTINSTLDLDTALQRIMEQAVQILKAEAGSLFLVDSSGKALTFEVVLGPTGSDLLGMSTPVGKGIVGTVAQTGRPLIINDVAADPRWNVAFDEATEFQTKDIICVPLIAFDERVIGVIELINKQDGSVFSEEDSDLLLSFASRAAIAIENARIFTLTDQALAERVQDLEALQMFDRQLQASLELERVLDISLTQMMDSLGVSMGLIGILDENGDDESGLYLLAQRGMPTEMGRYKVDPWPINKGVIGRVARTRELALINNMADAKEYVPKNHLTRSLLVLPILRENRVIGVLDLESMDPDYFTNDDVTFARLMSNHAAIAIENAQLFEKVKEANDAKSEFMRIAAHELKTPMTSIKGYTKLMSMGAAGELSEKQSDFLNIVTNNVDRMDRLVQDLLDVSRIDAGRIRLEIQDVHMQDVIDEVLLSTKTQIEAKHLELTIEVDELPELRADYRRIVQILTNLISNAYKYTPEGGGITVIAKPYHGNGQGGGISVTVKDTGYGISEEDQAKLFTNFFRASDQNIRNEPGTGLGLSITKNIIESHGGELIFESELNKGSSFTFTLPLILAIPPNVEVIER